MFEQINDILLLFLLITGTKVMNIELWNWNHKMQGTKTSSDTHSLSNYQRRVQYSLTTGVLTPLMNSNVRINNTVIIQIKYNKWYNEIVSSM